MNYTFITFFHSHTKTLNQKFRLKYCYIGTTIKRDNHQRCVAASCTVAGLFFGSEERPESREERLLAAIKGYRGSPTVRSLTDRLRSVTHKQIAFLGPFHFRQSGKSSDWSIALVM